MCMWYDSLLVKYNSNLTTKLLGKQKAGSIIVTSEYHEKSYINLLYHHDQI